MPTCADKIFNETQILRVAVRRRSEICKSNNPDLAGIQHGLAFVRLLTPILIQR
jgi:hypothetical protein